MNKTLNKKKEEDEIYNLLKSKENIFSTSEDIADSLHSEFTRIETLKESFERFNSYNEFTCDKLFVLFLLNIYILLKIYNLSSPESNELIKLLLKQVDVLFNKILILIKTNICRLVETHSIENQAQYTIINGLIIGFFKKSNNDDNTKFKKVMIKYYNPEREITLRTYKRLELLQNYIKTQANAKLGLTYRILGRGGSKTRQRKSKSSKKHSRKTKKSRKG
jgi:hypothetical protein